MVWCGWQKSPSYFFVVGCFMYIIKKKKFVQNKNNVQVSSPNASLFVDILHILPNIKREKEKKACARDKKQELILFLAKTFNRSRFRKFRIC